MQSQEFFADLNKGIKSQLPVVAYRLHGEKSSVKLMIQKDSEINRVQDFTESGFVFAEFQSTSLPLFIPQENSKCFELNGYERKLKTSEIIEHPEKLAKKKAFHIDLVKNAIAHIKQGDFQKVVLSRAENFSHNISAEQLFKNLLTLYPGAFVYLWSHPSTETWLGATPETLLKTERNSFKTMSLAGTRRANQIGDVIWTQKEREEQQIVTDSILANLKELDYNRQDLQLDHVENSAAGNLVHLRTDIIGKLNNSDNKETGRIIKALHPTPAICGLPREKAFQFITKYENYDREYYTGYLGELNILNETKRNSRRRNQENQQFASLTRSSNIFVNLRCLKFEENTVKIFVGGGITKDSVAENEWEETVNKSRTMKNAL